MAVNTVDAVSPLVDRSKNGHGHRDVDMEMSMRCIWSGMAIYADMSKVACLRQVDADRYVTYVV